MKPSRPELPAVSRGDWARTAIDRFVLARLEREKLTPSPEASRPTLLRRVTLDLTGLPPTPEEVDAFLADTAPDAYERVVDRLLASPRYGERWARPWLDLARYADTNGYEKDNRRDIWKYRDWVIDAFNRDLPFDQFTVEQIAGDLLPKPTIEQKIATGFHRNAMTNEEGGVDPEESRYEVLVDRVNTTATVWLGTTLGCARSATTTSTIRSRRRTTSGCSRSSRAATSTAGRSATAPACFEPTLDLATPEQETARKALQAEIDRLDKELKTSTPELREAQARWEESLRAAQGRWTPLTPKDATATNGVLLRTHAGWVDPRVGAEPAADGLHRHRNHDGRADHRRANRSPAGSVVAPRRSRARRLRPFPRHRPARPGRSRGWKPRRRSRWPSRP